MIFCSALQAGGAERVLSVLSTPLADHYEQVIYLMWKDAPVFYGIDSRVKLVSVERESGGGHYVKRLWWMRRYIQKEQPDLVLSFSAPFNMLALMTLLGTRQRIVVAERVDPRSFRWGRIRKWARIVLYHVADGILTQTPSGRSFFKGALLKKTSVIYNPVLIPEILVGAAVKTVKKPMIVSVGRLVKQKQLLDLIRAFAQFYQTHPSYSLVIYGDGPELPNLQSCAAELGVEQAVHFSGTVSNVWEQLLSAEMFVMSSRFEGMSNALIEAMCLGIPSISTKVSGAIDLIEHGQNGFLVDMGDVEKIYYYMDLLASDRDLATKLGKQASFLYADLAVDVIAKQWISYLDGYILK